MQENPGAVCRKLQDFLGKQAEQGLLDQILDRDSQEDTVISRTRLLIPLSFDAPDSLAALWDRHCPHDLLDTLEIRHR